MAGLQNTQRGLAVPCNCTSECHTWSRLLLELVGMVATIEQQHLMVVRNC